MLRQLHLPKTKKYALSKLNWYLMIIFSLLPITLLFLTSPANAEGSRELVANGGYRPYLQVDATTFPTEMAGITRRAVIKVFVNAGEEVNLGSSIHDSLNDPTQDIVYRSPTGIEGSCDVLQTGFGYIDTVDKEKIGPFPNQGGYEPCLFIADETGIYEIEFQVSQDVQNQIHPRQKTVTADFLKKERQGNSVAAWDVTVLKTPGDPNTEQKGRVYANFLPLRLGGRRAFIETTLFIQSNTGYLYRFEAKTFHPLNYLLVSNNKGLKDVPGETGLPVFQSVESKNIGNTVFMHDAAALDTTTDITHKIFFNLPDADDLPREANLPGGKTWLLNPPAPLPEVTNFQFFGSEGTSGQMGTVPLTGNFTFNSNMAGNYFMTLDINNNNIYGDGNDRLLRGRVNEGDNSITWDGLDGNGDALPAQYLPVTIHAKLSLIDDVHFPFFDPDKSINGITITRLNCEQSPCIEENDIVYYNNASLPVNGTPPEPIAAMGGISSRNGVQKFDEVFSKRNVIDSWATLFPAIELEGGILIRQADLTISKTHTTELPVPGGPIQYVITVRNGGPNDVSGVKIQDSLPATATEPVWTCEVSDSSKPAPAIQNSCATGFAFGQIDTTVDLQSGATATFIVDATISETAVVGDTITNSATITRPNDVTNPQGSTGDVKTETAEHSFTIAPPANEVPVANNLTATTDNETTLQMPALNATDDDGTIASYTLFNLPLQEQGLLYLGDPTASGTLISEGQQLTAAQLSNLFFQPNTSFSGDTTFNYTAIDDQGAASNTAIVTITVTIAPNEPPVADDKTADETTNNTPIKLPALSATDPDENGSIASYTIATLPPTSQGVLYFGDPDSGGIQINQGQTLTPNEISNLYFQPNTNFTGNASFTYTALDNKGTESNVATVTIPVIAANQPPVAKDKTASETPNNVTIQLPALEATDDGTVVSYQITSIPPTSAGLLYVGDPNKGGRLISSQTTLTPVDANDLFFKPNKDFSGDTNLTYTATDNHDEVSNTATVTISVTEPPNNPPIANNDSSDTDPGVPVTISVLSDDSDPDDNLDPTNMFLTDAPANGTATVNNDGTIVYTPNADFTEGSDTFSYQVCDTGTPILCDTAKVTVDVPLEQKPPVADNKTAATTLNNTTAELPSLSASDEDGTIASYTIETLPPSEQGVLYLGDPASGGVPITPGQTLTPDQVDNLFFEPNSNFIGDASFTYSATDDQGATSSPALVTIPVEAAPNTRPSISDDSASTNPDTPVTIPVLGNDSDSEGSLDKGSITISTQPPNGTVTINDDGSITYTPNPGFEGTDSFTYEVCDTGLPPQCETAEVTIDVTTDNKPPVADSKSTPATPNTITISIPALSATDSDGTVVSYTIDTLPPPSQGELLLGNETEGLTPVNAGDILTPEQVSTLVFQPNDTFIGNASFTYTATDDKEAVSNAALVTIPVTAAPDNQPPTVTDDRTSVDPETPVVIAVLENDSDPEAGLDLDTLTITVPPTKGNAVVNEDGTITYTPNPGVTTGTDSFTYEICDVGNPQECDTAVVTIAVPDPENKPPVADNLEATTTTNDTIASLPALSATDEDGTIASYNVATLPKASQGILYLGNPANGGTTITAGQVLTPAQISQLFFQPAPNFVGKASFSYTATDNLGAISSSALMNIPVTAPENTPPTANDVSAETDQDTPVTIPVLNNDSDPNGNLDEASISITEQPENGTVTVNPDGTVTFTPNEGFFGTDSFTYQVCDTGTPPLCDTATVELDISPTTLPPFELRLRITGSGSVISEPTGLDCNSDNDPCTQNFDGGTEVTLAPTPEDEWEFEGWRGHCNDEGQATMDADKQCQAIFVPVSALQVTLNVARSGPGIITSVPTGIDCGTDCEETYNLGTEVTITATADPGFVLTEWTGDCSGTNHTITVTMDANKRCQANFAPDEDEDGVADEIEDGAPNNGDGNGDGIPDSQQDNVASLIGPDGNYITVAENNGCPITNARPSEQDLPTDSDNYLPVPLDLEFECDEADVSTYYHDVDDFCDENNTIRQYVPTTPGDSSTAEWQDLPAECETTTIDGKTVPTVNFQLKDGQLGDSTGVDGRILNTSGRLGAPTQVQFSLPNYTIDEFGNIATITVNRQGSCEGRVTVDYATEDGTATQGEDYTDVFGTIRWNNDDCSDKTFTVPIQDDLLAEDNETINLLLSSSNSRVRQSLDNNDATIATPEAVLTIIDDDTKSTSTNSCVDTSACQVCCPTCQPISSDLKIRSLSTTIRVGETVEIILADGEGELLIKEIPNSAFVSFDNWKPLNNGAGEITLTGVSVGETEMVITDSAAPLQTVTIYITVIPELSDGFGFKAIQTTLQVGQQMDLTVAGGQGELAISELPDTTLVLLSNWAPLGETGVAQFTLTGISVGATKAVIIDRATPAQQTTVNITVVEGANNTSDNNSTTNGTTNDPIDGNTDNPIDGTQETDAQTCVPATSVNAQGNPIADSQACFTNILRIGEKRQPNHRRLTYAEAQTLYLSVEATIEPAHLGKAADILLLAGRSTTLKNANYVRNEQTWYQWDEQFSSLPSAQYYPKLPEKIEVFIFEDDLSFAPGEYTVFVGYRLEEDDTIVYNGTEPLHFFVSNSASLDLSLNSAKTTELNEINSTTIFEPYVYNFDGKLGNYLTFEYDDGLNVSTFVHIEPRHIGQSAEILIVAEYIGSIQRRYYTRIGPNWQTWNSRLDSLLAVQHYQKLPESMEIPIDLDTLTNLAGHFIFYVGYRLADKTLVFNGYQPVKLTVANGIGMESTGNRIPTIARFVTWAFGHNGHGNPFNTPTSKPLGLAATIFVDPEHVGQIADIEMVALKNPANPLLSAPPEGTFSLWGAWDENTERLEKIIPNVTLEEVIKGIPLFEPEFKKEPGDYVIYIGYRLDNGNIIYNGGETLRLSVTAE
jgi:uncharacterized repeat protein (TIGR01451 family)